MALTVRNLGEVPAAGTKSSDRPAGFATNSYWTLAAISIAPQVADARAMAALTAMAATAARRDPNMFTSIAEKAPAAELTIGVDRPIGWPRDGGPRRRLEGKNRTLSSSQAENLRRRIRAAVIGRKPIE